MRASVALGLRTPLFAWQSRYDLDQQKNDMGCPNPHRWPAPLTVVNVKFEA